MNSIPSNTCILHNFTAVLSLLTDRRRPEYVVLPVDCFSFHATSLMVFLCVLLLLTIIIIISLGNEHQILLLKKYIYLNQEHYGRFYGRNIDIYFHLFVKRRMKMAGVMYYYYYYYFLIKDTNDYHDSWRGFLSWLLIVSNFTSKVFLIAPTTSMKKRVRIKKMFITYFYIQTYF